MATFIHIPAPQMVSSPITSGMAMLQPALAQIADQILQNKHLQAQYDAQAKAQNAAMIADAIDNVSGNTVKVIDNYYAKKKQKNEDAALDMIANRLDPGSYAYDQTTKATGTNTGTMGLLNGGGVQSYLPVMSPVTRINGVLAETAKRYPNTNIVRNVQGSVLGAVLKDQISKAFPRPLSVLDQKRIEKINAEIEATKNRSTRNAKTQEELQKIQSETNLNNARAGNERLKPIGGALKYVFDSVVQPFSKAVEAAGKANKGGGTQKKAGKEDPEKGKKGYRDEIAMIEKFYDKREKDLSEQIGNIEMELANYNDVPADEPWYWFNTPAHTKVGGRTATSEELRMRDEKTAQLSRLRSQMEKLQEEREKNFSRLKGMVEGTKEPNAVPSEPPPVPERPVKNVPVTQPTTQQERTIPTANEFIADPSHAQWLSKFKSEQEKLAALATLKQKGMIR